MKFGVREIANVVFKAKDTMEIGNATFKPNQPVLYIDSATASTLEQATTSVYAQGGRGNTRLVTWEGEKTLTFTVTDALISPISLSILSGAGLIKNDGKHTNVHVHVTSKATIEKTEAGVKYIDLTKALTYDKEQDKYLEFIDPTAPIFVSYVEEDGSLTGKILEKCKVGKDQSTATTQIDDGLYIIPSDSSSWTDVKGGESVFVDFYINKLADNVNEIQIDAASFGGNFYVEASTLFRSKSGKDYPVEITIPNVKVQSNFTFSMAATGDPSTFDFTMDAMPDYTLFDKTKEVLCVMQIVEDTKAGVSTRTSVMGHVENGEKIPNTEKADDDSVIG